ncbi:MAG: ATP synthase F1 subunit delta [Planctomycetes bacterium]|nr:ATP synthase F1 subunit delta [Planctomycetota bacterium]
MIEEVIARRYAKALATAAFEKNALDDVSKDVRLLADIFIPGIGDVYVPEFADFLQTPTVLLRDKLKMTDELCAKIGIGELVSNFLNVLIRRNRTRLIARVVRHYLTLAAKLKNVQEAFVYSAAPLSDAQRERLEAALTKKLGKPTKTVCKVVPGLLAGQRIRIGDVLLENSVQGRLSRLERALA